VKTGGIALELSGIDHMGGEDEPERGNDSLGIVEHSV
jgi:hypothetical protein